MVILTKKKQEELQRRFDELGDKVKCSNETIIELQEAVKELRLIVENITDSGETRRTPQQLLREWMLGKEDES